MKTVAQAFALVLALAATACGHQPSASATAAAKTKKTLPTSRPAVGIVLDGADAAAFITVLIAAGVEKLSAIESTSWSTAKIECSHSFSAQRGLLSSCSLALAAAVNPSTGVQRPATAIALDGAAAQRLITLLNDRVGIKPLSAIESTSWTTGPVECSRTFDVKKGVLSSCRVGLVD